MIKLSGHIVGDKDTNGLYPVHVPLLDLWTQCTHGDEAAEKAKDAIGLLLENKTGGKLSAKDIHIVKIGPQFLLTTEVAEEIILSLKKVNK